jgi:hypothetical protein
MWRPVGAMLTHERASNVDRHATKHLSLSVNMTPCGIGFSGFQVRRVVGFEVIIKVFL